MARPKKQLAPEPPQIPKLKAGHPPKPIDWAIADRMLEAGCSGVEVASYFGVYPVTFYNRVEKEKGMLFTHYQFEKRHRGDVLLRVKQFEMALAGDRVMLVWLGKNRLGQKDNPEGLSDSKSAVEKYINNEKDKIDVRDPATQPKATDKS